MNERSHLLQEIRKYAFAIQESALYLDGHPGSTEALSYLRENVKKKKEAVAAFELKYGAFTHCGDEATSTWSWVSTPFPWEEE